MNPTGALYHPDFGEAVEFDTIPLSDDPDTQVAQTIHMMGRHVREDAESWPVRQAAAEIERSGTGDKLADTFWWVKNRIGFRQDARLAGPMSQWLEAGQNVVELLVRPRDLLNMRTPLEDCDGFASLLPSLLRAQGVPCFFRTVAADAREPGRLSHVYAVCQDQSGSPVPLDASHGPYPGWECTQTGQVTRVKDWRIDGPSFLELMAIAAALAGAFYLAHMAGWV